MKTITQSIGARHLATLVFCILLMVNASAQEATPSDQAFKERIGYAPPEPKSAGMAPKAPAGSIEVNEDPAYAAYDANGLVQNVLVQGCLQAINVNYTGYWNSSNPYNRGLGYFHRGTSNFPIKEGLILSSGYVGDAAGPNNAYNTSREVGTPGDADLAKISGGTTYDAAVLEFDFVPAGNIVEFKYIFASEEYLEYACSEYNDVFAFLLSGPGITNDPGLTGKNIAKLPDGVTPVTINNIHGQGREQYSSWGSTRWRDNSSCTPKNAQYYVDNGDGSTQTGANPGGVYMQYDGRTVVLTAYHEVVPCQTYHIKLAVADVSDRKYDSGIFLEGSSFFSEQLSLTHTGNGILNNNNIFEGCLNNKLVVTRQTDDLSEPYDVDLILAGSAINGTDILTTGNQPFPTQITIPAGQASFEIPYYAVDDGAGDNNETFIVRVRNSCPCDEAIVYAEKIIRIYEQVTIASLTAQNAACNGQNNGVITVNATGGSGTYEYSINNGTTWQTSNTFSGLLAGNYTILVRDPGSCYNPVSGTTTVGQPTPIDANAGPDVAICSGSSTQLNGSGGVLYSWSPATGLNNANIANPVATPATTTTYTLTVTNATGQCPDSDQVTVTVNPSPTVTVLPVEVEICRGESTTLTASGANSYVWNPGGATTASITVSPNSNANYTVIGTSTNGCTAEASATVVVNSAPTNVSAGADAAIGLCEIHQLQGSATGTNLTYSWTPATNLSNANIANPVFTPTASGTFTYTLTVTGNNGCSATDMVQIEVAEELTSTAEVVNNSCTNTPDGSINLSVEGGTTPYSFAWTGPEGFISSLEDIDNLLAGTYQIVVTDADGCSVSASYNVLTIPDNIAPVPNVNPLPAATGECSVTVTVPNATDNCDGVIQGTTSNPLVYTEQGTYTITWTYTDSKGNSSSQEQTVIVDDVTAPIAPVIADATGECSVTVTAPTAEDNCAGTVTGTTTNPLTYNTQGTYIITWTFDDGNENSSTAEQTVVVADVTNPTIICPSDINVNTDAGSVFATNVNLGTPVTNDNCGIASVSNNELTSYPIGQTEVIWTVTDIAGNTASCTQIVTVNDDGEPEISCPPAITVNCDTEIPAAYANYAAFTAAGGIATDDNGINEASFIMVSQTSDNNTCPETITRTYSIEDNAGNSSTCEQFVIVNDEIAPVIEVAPLAVTVSCIDDVPAMINLSWTDNCGGSGNVAGNDSELVGGACGGTITRTWNVIDACGNAAETRTQIITVNDEIAPVIEAAPIAVTVSCIEDAPAMINLSWTDNCGGSGEVTGNDSELVGGACGGTITRTWNVTDACGNAAETRTQIITVNDEIAPVIEAAPIAVTVSCIEEVPAMINLSWTDNCGGSGEVTGNDSELVGGACGGTITRTWNVTDACGNAAETRIQIITVNDEIAPVITLAAANQTVECDGSGNNDALNTWLASNGGATATDNCGDITWTNDFTALSDLCGATGAATVIFTATDECGNSTPTTATFTIEDTTPPALTCPTNISVTADAGQAYATVTIAVPAISDACGTVTLVNDFTGVADASGEYLLGTTTVTYTATDDCGNEITCTFTVTVTDDEAPVINCPATITVSCDTEIPAAYADYAAFVAAGGSATDNNGINEISFALVNEITDGASCPETITRTYSIEDLDGNASTCEQLIIVNDDIAPVITAEAADLSVECDGLGNTAALTAWIASNGGATATDNCSDVTWSNNFEGLSSLCGATGTATVTFTVTDACGNFTPTTATFTIVDVTAPVFTIIPEDLTVECDGSGNELALENWLANVAATDVCGEVTITNDFTGLSDLCGATGTATVTWTATDDCGNTATTTATFTIVDETAPVFTIIPEDLTVECDGAGNELALENWLANVAATDVCGEVEITNNFEGLSDLCGATGTATVTWTATDDCGNTATTTATFTIVDETAPVFTIIPEDLTVECDGAGNELALENWLANVAATDVCGEVTITNDFNGLSDGCGATGTATVTWTATDDCGNTTTTTATFTIVDETAPVFTIIPEDLTVECDGAGNELALENWLANVAATDVCGEVTITNDFTGLSDLCGATGTSTVTWTAMDDCGNTATTTATFTIVDVTAPVFTIIPEDLTVECDGAGNELALENWLANVAATDVCGEVAITNNFSGLSDGCGATGTATVTWTATDDCGNTATTTATFTIVDVTAPVFTIIPEDLTVECDGSGNELALENWLANVAATDVCGEVTITNDFTGLSDLCGATGTATVTWTATDDCGNTATTTATFTIVDVTAPVFTIVPADMTIECDVAGNALALENWLANVAATDVCGEVAITNNFSGLSDGCGATGTATVTWTATDDCGNTATTTATFTIVDETAPVFTVLPEYTIVECDGNGNVEELEAWLNSPVAVDNCGDVTLTHDFEGLTALCGATGLATVTWTATDECGNSTTASATFAIFDYTDPTFDVIPEDLVVECDGNGNTDALNAWLESASASDICGDVTITHDFEGLTPACGATGSVTVIWTATDDCNNSTTASATFTIIDVTAPVFTLVPEDMTVECDAAGNELALENWLANVAATDVCGDVTITHNFNGLSNGCGNTGAATVTWTATDDCGNTATTSATFTIIDEIAPFFTSIPENLTVECDGQGNEESLENWLTGVAAADNCGEVTITHNFTGLSNLCGATGAATVTWTATDDCGNTATTSATFTIEDTMPPSLVCPQNITVNTDAGQCGAYVQVPIPNTSDECSGVNLVNDYTGTALASGYYEVGTTVVVFTATDACGNASTCQMTVTVIDNEAPVITCPENITVNNDPGVCEANVSVPQPEVSDNCEVQSVVNSFNNTANASGVYPAGTTTVTWTVTDIHGLSSTCEMTITVIDTEAPVITCPADIAVNNDPGVCQANVTVPQPVVSDNCGVESVVNSFNGTGNASGTYPVGTTTITWTVTDINGMTASCDMTVTVTDTEAPVITCPEDISVNNDPGVCEANVTVPQPEVSDNCGVESVVNSFNGTADASGVYPAGTTTVTWTVTDIHGMTASCDMTVTVTDTEAPVITCPEDIVVNNDPGVCEANVTIPQPEASDNCGIESMVNSFNGTADASGVYPVGTTVVTWTVTDINGLTAECEMTITVNDTELPVITCPEDMTVTAGADCNAVVDVPEPVVSDNCGIESVINSFNNTANASGVYPVGVHTITWTVTDIHGNVADCEMQLTVIAGPIANDDFATTDVNVPVSIPVLLNDTDCDDNIDPSTVTVITDPAHGFTMVDPQTGNVLYTPNTNYTGVDTFVYRVCDLSGLCDQALVTITIGDAQQIRLVAVDDSYTTLMNTPKDINNMENDIIPEGVAAAIEILTPTSNGSLVLHDDMTVTYTPAADFIGEDQYSYILYDVNGIAISDTAIAIITIVADDARPELIIYNAITPNGDGKNDTWVIDGIEEYPDNEVLLFNRWSDQIREFTGYNNGSEVWDGTNQFGKKLPDATYYYIIRLRSINKIYTGWVIIHGGSN